MEYQRDEHRVHLIAFHIVFCPKRRKAVLVDQIAVDCDRLIRRKCEEQGWHIIALEVMPDHVHLFVRVWPATSVENIVKENKGLTSHELRAKHPILRRLPSLWTRSYFAASCGNVSSEVVKKYIEAQKGI